MDSSDPSLEMLSLASSLYRHASSLVGPFAPQIKSICDAYERELIGAFLERDMLAANSTTSNAHSEFLPVPVTSGSLLRGVPPDQDTLSTSHESTTTDDQEHELELRKPPDPIDHNDDDSMPCTLLCPEPSPVSISTASLGCDWDDGELVVFLPEAAVVNDETCFADPHETDASRDFSLSSNTCVMDPVPCWLHKLSQFQGISDRILPAMDFWYAHL